LGRWERGHAVKALMHIERTVGWRGGDVCQDLNVFADLQVALPTLLMLNLPASQSAVTATVTNCLSSQQCDVISLCSGATFAASKVLTAGQLGILLVASGGTCPAGTKELNHTIHACLVCLSRYIPLHFHLILKLLLPSFQAPHPPPNTHQHTHHPGSPPPRPPWIK